MKAFPAPIDPRLLEPSLAEFRQSYTLPGEAYTSPELFAWEMRNFFEPSWVCIGRTEGMMDAAWILQHLPPPWPRAAARRRLRGGHFDPVPVSRLDVQAGRFA